MTSFVVWVIMPPQIVCSILSLGISTSFLINSHSWLNKLLGPNQVNFNYWVIFWNYWEKVSRWLNLYSNSNKFSLNCLWGHSIKLRRPSFSPIPTRLNVIDMGAFICIRLRLHNVQHWLSLHEISGNNDLISLAYIWAASFANLQIILTKTTLVLCFIFECRSHNLWET